MKEYERCIEECDKAIQKSQEGYYDYVKLGKALARKAGAMAAQAKFDEAIDLYKTSLLENNDANVKEQLKKTEKLKKEDEERKMIDPVKAEEHMQAGKEYFQKFDFPSAVREFSEGIKRNPTSTAIYSNRSATYIKLMEFPHALKDAEKCLQLDPNFVKGYLRKGICHHFLKEYHKALDTFDKGLKLDADNKEIKEAKLKTMQAIQMGSYAGGNKKEDDEERVRHA